MIRTEKRLRICTALLIVNLIIIWGNSLLPGNISGAISDSVKEFLEAGLTLLFPGGFEGSQGSSFLLRKLGHFLEFTALGVCLSWLLGMLGKSRLWPVPSGVAVAAIDETIQFFVPGRACRLMDVGIDSCGVLFGMLLLYLGHSYCRRRKDKEKKQ